MSCAPGYRTCEPGRRTSAGNSTLSMRRPPISTPTSNSPTTWKDSSPGSIPTPPPPRCRTASGSCGCSSRTSSSTPKRSPSPIASQHVPAPAGTTPNPTRRVTMAPVIHCVGGVISPVLMNVALHGLEQSAGARYFADDRKDAGNSVPGTPVVVRYADDLVALCVSAEQAKQAKQRLASCLWPRGRAFNEDKARVVSLDRGFAFLGFNVRRYRNGKLLIKPSKEAVRRIRKRLAAEVKALYGANAEAVISRLNPIIRGWAAYYRSVVSKETFSSLDHYVWRLTYRWAKRTHPNKSRRWVIARYFGMFNSSRRDRWVFGDRDSGRYLVKFSWTRIVRHQMVTGGASSDDPALADYWARRRRRRRTPLGAADSHALRAQSGCCPRGGHLLLAAGCDPLSPHEGEQWFPATGTAIGRQAIPGQATPGAPDEPAALRLVHAHCARRQTAGHATQGPAAQPAREPAGLA